MARLGRAVPNVPIVIRSTLEDPQVETTPGPVIVIGSPGRRGVPNAGLAVRATLEDPPVETTPAPLVVTHRGIRFGRPNQAHMGLRSSLEDAATRNLQLSLGAPEVKWRTGNPDVKWQPGSPET